jgi:hypothetical protein
MSITSLAPEVSDSSDKVYTTYQTYFSRTIIIITSKRFLFFLRYFNIVPLFRMIQYPFFLRKLLLYKRR